MTRGVFVDRDGVINRALLKNGRAYAPTSLAELDLIDGVPETVRSLRQAGFLVIVVTNQPDVATGVQSRETVEAIHAHLRARIDVDDIKACFHVDGDQCACRKPKPGMLLQAAEEWDVNLKQSYMVGDTWRDIEAGRAAGCKTILVGSGYAEKPALDPDAVVESLREAAAMILAAAL
ncbi:MAG: HAD family hydrolase [Acidobacteria bacterium]|nr:HAD family hydrolase [Acidobacteriota bacterium]